MGSIYRKGKKLYAAVKNTSGEWTKIATGFDVGHEREAKKFARDLEARVAAGLAHGAAEKGPVSLRRYFEGWIADRKSLGLSDVGNDESRIKHHVLPALGDMPIAEIRARHVVDLVRKLRTSGRFAPKTIYNIYSNLKAVFRDAQMADLIDATPCVLTKYQLGENVDKNPEWRPTAIFSRGELETLISDDRIPSDRRVFYALEGIGGLRLGEAAGLRFRHVDLALEPLGQILVATSYDKGRTKTKQPRKMPVHPTLAAVLAEWKLAGWQAMTGRAPGPDDLAVPMPPDDAARRRSTERREPMRTKTYAFKRLRDDLVATGLRHRRGHDLRRTMISLARTDGARRDLLELCTHNPKKGSGAIDLYTTFPWEALCEEVAKLKVQRRPPGGAEVIPLIAAGGSGGTSAPIGREEDRGLSANPFYRFSTGPKKNKDLNSLGGGGAGSRT